MRFKWCGTATVLFESGESRLLVDPYLRKMSVPPALSQNEARSADAIFITHPHLDHFADIDAFSEGVTPVYVSKTGIALARKNGLAAQCMRPVAAGDTVQAGAFTVRAFAARHCRFDLLTVLRVLFSARTWRHFKDTIRLLRGAAAFRIRRKDVLAFEISDNNKRVLLFGSADFLRGECYPQESDLLLFPYQGRTRPERALARVLKATRPQAVAIDHFDDAFPPVTYRVDTARFLPTAGQQTPPPRAFEPAEGIWYEI